MTMDPRKQRVLQAIVALYAMEGEPVGSGLLSNYLDLSVSSATLRTEMAALTKLGLLEQPHTSAGRVPSTKGYRYYLDNLLDADEQLPAAERQAIDDIFDDLDYEPEHLAQGAARALSRHTGFTAAVTTPRADDLCIAHFEVVQVGRYSAAVLGVTSAGGVCTRVARVAEGLTRQQAANVAAVLNQNLTFVSPADLTPRLLAGMGAALGADGMLLSPVLLAAAALLREAVLPKAYLEGQQTLLEWPELAPSVGKLLQAFDDGERARKLLSPAKRRTVVKLGEDLETPMPGLCIMSSRYLAGGGLTGNLAIIGTNRMPFEQLMPRLEYFARKLGQCMSGRTQEDDV